MPSPVPDQPPAAAPSAPQQTGSGSRPSSGHAALPPSPVEMKNLPTSGTTNTPASDPAPSAPNEDAQEQTTDAQPSQTEDAAASTSAASRPAQTPDLNRAETEAIGPSTDTPAETPDHSDGPVLSIMLLLTTGARHPYRIDEKYLKKRGVTVDDMDPYNISVYTLKELIWRDWRPEWEPRPTSPSSIRLIHFGRMLDDKSPLNDCRFQTVAPNVVHMTIKPQEVIDDDDAKTGKDGRRRDGEEEPTAGCRCVIL